jgi:hypothetical protein
VPIAGASPASRAANHVAAWRRDRAVLARASAVRRTASAISARVVMSVTLARRFTMAPTWKTAVFRPEKLQFF